MSFSEQDKAFNKNLYLFKAMIYRNLSERTEKVWTGQALDDRGPYIMGGTTGLSLCAGHK